MSNDKQFKDVDTLKKAIANEIGLMLGEIHELDQFKGFELEVTVWMTNKVFGDESLSVQFAQAHEANLEVCTDKWLREFGRDMKKSLDQWRRTNPVDILVDFAKMPISPLHLWCVRVVWQESLETLTNILQSRFQDLGTEEALLAALDKVIESLHVNGAQLILQIKDTDELFDKINFPQYANHLAKVHPLSSKVIFTYAMVNASRRLFDAKVTELRSARGRLF